MASNPYSIYEIYKAFNHLQLASSLPQLDELFRVYLAMPISKMDDTYRTRSVLKRCKNWLRNTMGKDVPNNLALLNIERELTGVINIGSAIKMYEERNKITRLK